MVSVTDPHGCIFGFLDHQHRMNTTHNSTYSDSCRIWATYCNPLGLTQTFIMQFQLLQ
jgi:hypothetical protein